MLVFIISNIVLCIIIALNAYFETPLFILGINFIFEYQKSAPW